MIEKSLGGNELFSHNEENETLSPAMLLKCYESVKGIVEESLLPLKSDLRVDDGADTLRLLDEYFHTLSKRKHAKKREAESEQERLAIEALTNFYLLVAAETILAPEQSHADVVRLREGKPYEKNRKAAEHYYGATRVQEGFIDQMVNVSVGLRIHHENIRNGRSAESDTETENAMEQLWGCYDSIQSYMQRIAPYSIAKAEGRKSGCIGETVAAQLAHEIGYDVFLSLDSLSPDTSQMDDTYKIDQIWVDQKSNSAYMVQVKRDRSQRNFLVASPNDADFSEVMNQHGLEFERDADDLKKGARAIGQRFKFERAIPLVVVIPGEDSNLYLPNSGIPTDRGVQRFDSLLSCFADEGT